MKGARRMACRAESGSMIRTSNIEVCNFGVRCSFSLPVVNRSPNYPYLCALKSPFMKICCLLLPALFFASEAFAQEIQINEDPAVTQMVRAWTNNNRAEPHLSGWRVQIMASTDRQQVENGRDRFRTEYPDVPADWVLEKPYYKLRVGAFRSKQEALGFISDLDGWPGAYPAKDSNIHPRDFLEQ